MTTTEHADQPADAPTASTAKPGLVYPKMWVLFVVLICCFTAWGVAADLTTPMVAGFKRIFEMNTFQASLVQLAYFGAYFLLAMPAAFINQRFGYKAGLLVRRAARRRGRDRVLSGEQDHDLRGVPGRAVRDRRRLLDPRDVRQPLRDVARVRRRPRRGDSTSRRPSTPSAPTSVCCWLPR